MKLERVTNANKDESEKPDETMKNDVELEWFTSISRSAFVCYSQTTDCTKTHCR